MNRTMFFAHRTRGPRLRAHSPPSRMGRLPAFTLVEVIVVIAIIAVLISLLVPSMSRARNQAKKTQCLSNLKEIGRGLAFYAEDNAGVLPPLLAPWHQTMQTAIEDGYFHTVCRVPFDYGWAELLYQSMYPGTQIDEWEPFPAQRNVGGKYGGVFNCPSAQQQIGSAGHFRAYAIGWLRESTEHDEYGRYEGPDTLTEADLFGAPLLARIEPQTLLIGEGEERSIAGDGLGDYYNGPCCLVNLCGPHPETNFVGTVRHKSSDIKRYNQANTEYNEHRPSRAPNRFAHRHDGGGNYLFADVHVEFSKTLRGRLGCDWDQDGIVDPLLEGSAEFSGCEGWVEGR